MSEQPAFHRFKAGDRIRIRGEAIAGVVTGVGRHDVSIRVEAHGRTEHRRYAHEAVVLEPIMIEVSNFTDR